MFIALRNRVIISKPITYYSNYNNCRFSRKTNYIRHNVYGTYRAFSLVRNISQCAALFSRTLYEYVLRVEVATCDQSNLNDSLYCTHSRKFRRQSSLVISGPNCFQFASPRHCCRMQISGYALLSNLTTSRHKHTLGHLFVYKCVSVCVSGYRYL